MIEVPAAITMAGTFACVAIGATASAAGVSAEAGDDVDLVVDDQFLREALGVVRHAGVVLEDHFDLLAGDGRAVLLDIELDGGLDLLAGRRLIGPVIGTMSPILTVSCADAPPAVRRPKATAAAAVINFLFNMKRPPICFSVMSFRN